ncbi:hypothetical protein OVA06_18785 [Pseudarthrobacter sp. SL88]|nr:hypothetical protein [Pseudarthrobacter sp. SL88]MCY1676721.1 hypothetical protein [Pseudarthrobacter sp. SL88]
MPSSFALRRGAAETIRTTARTAVEKRKAPDPPGPGAAVVRVG